MEEAVDRQNLNPPFQDSSFADQEEEGTVAQRGAQSHHCGWFDSTALSLTY